ncbi:hypothetical protein NDU88_008040 [Pleurodeles waltl]|uniref:Uncharacterized protein n=1 Tax=Pleurodeles waltl TaxID=8319 RepID=A0AAV7RR68_PLEWA|nr:hypothetical protein NDU88_008040 [Pleurodeles waltl]
MSPEGWARKTKHHSRVKGHRTLITKKKKQQGQAEDNLPPQKQNTPENRIQAQSTLPVPHWKQTEGRETTDKSPYPHETQKKATPDRPQQSGPEKGIQEGAQHTHRAPSARRKDGQKKETGQGHKKMEMSKETPRKSAQHTEEEAGTKTNRQKECPQKLAVGSQQPKASRGGNTNLHKPGLTHPRYAAQTAPRAAWEVQPKVPTRAPTSAKSTKKGDKERLNWNKSQKQLQSHPEEKTPSWHKRQRPRPQDDTQERTRTTKGEKQGHRVRRHREPPKTIRKKRRQRRAEVG